MYAVRVRVRGYGYVGLWRTDEFGSPENFALRHASFFPILHSTIYPEILHPVYPWLGSYA